MKYVGINEVRKAVEENDVTVVYVGKDAEEHVISDLIKLCEEKNIEVRYIDTMEELGKMAGIEVKSAVAAE